MGRLIARVVLDPSIDEKTSDMLSESSSWPSID
jgi:hypothetical protein